MTTESDGKTTPAHIARRAGILAGLAAGWLAAMALIMLLAEPLPAALAIGGPELIGRMPDDIRLVRGSPHRMVVTSERPGYVGRLYAAGAWLVLPALRNGCLDLGKGDLRRDPGGLPTGLSRFPTGRELI